MKARILILTTSLVLVACNERPVAPPAPQIEAPSPSPSTRYLLRRVAVATEESLYGLDAGTELKLIEERPGRLLVQAEGMQFEIDPRDATDAPREAENALIRAKESKMVRGIAPAAQWQTEDRKFLAAENLRRSTAEQISHLRASIDSARAHIARLEAKPDRTRHGESIAALADRSVRSLEEDARRQSISLLHSYIVDCDRKIQTLSDATPGEE